MININTYTLPERDSIVCTRESLNQTLETFGVAVIPSVLTLEECEQMKQGQHQSLATLTSQLSPPFDVSKRETYDSAAEAGALHGMIFQSSGMGHAKYAWDIRQHPEVVANFVAFWGSADLRTSMDAVAAWYPRTSALAGTNKGNDWMHIDQAPKKHGLESIQSWVTGETVGVGDATLTVLLGGHRWHKEFHETFGADESGDWYRLKPEHIDFYLSKGCKLMSITCPAGSQVFFDSRTPHQGTLPHKDREVKDRIRCIVYVCMTPAKEADYEWRKGSKVFVGLERRKKTDQKRIELFTKGQNTSHCPHNFRSFAMKPHFYGPPKPLTQIGSPKKEWLTALGRKLVGFQ